MKIAIYTSTRADYGLLKPLIGKLIATNNFEIRIFVTGTHLEKDFGFTVSEIEKDFPQHIFYRVSQSMKEDVQLKNLVIMSEGIRKYAEALSANPPDITIVLGDRYEALCYGLVCASLSIPIIHIQGGELTLGAIDDKFRHCLTKLSEWHFTACEAYRKRVIQLGEKPETVFNVGSLGVDNALNQKLMSVNELEKDLGLKFPSEVYLFTFHPETNSKDYGTEILKAFLKKLTVRLEHKKALVVITGVNSDPGAQLIKETLQQFRSANSALPIFFQESLGLTRYLSIMKIATAVVGNSSSGILEAFSLKTPCVNLGLRQEGREREIGVIDLPKVEDLATFDFENVVKLKNKMLSSPDEKSIFGDGQTSVLMVQQIQRILQKSYVRMHKNFFDIRQ